MTHTKVIKLILAQKRLKATQVVPKMNEITPEAFRTKVNRQGILIKLFVDILDALDYQLVFQPKGKQPLSEKSYPIRWSDYNLNE